MRTHRFEGSFFDQVRQRCGYQSAAARPRCETCASVNGSGGLCLLNGLHVSRYSICNDWKPAVEGQKPVPNRSKTEAGAEGAARPSSASTARLSGGGS